MKVYTFVEGTFCKPELANAATSLLNSKHELRAEPQIIRAPGLNEVVFTSVAQNWLNYFKLEDLE